MGAAIFGWPLSFCAVFLFDNVKIAAYVWSMVQTPEGRVKAKVVRALKDAGAYYFFPATGGYGRSGVPDIVVCYRGHFIGIECKAGKNKLTALQEAEGAAIAAAGGTFVIVNEDNVPAVSGMLKLMDGWPAV